MASRRRRLLGAITIFCLTISLAAIPVATARPGHEKSTPAQAPAAATPPQPAPETHAAQSEKGAGASKGEGGEASKPAKRTKHAEAPAARQEAQGDGHGHATNARQEQAKGNARQEQAKGADAQTPSKAQHSGAETGESKSQAESRRAGEHAGKPVPAHVNHAKATQIEAARPSTISGKGGANPTEVPAAQPTAPASGAGTVASVAAAGPTTPASSVGQAKVATAPAVRAVRAQAKHRARSARVRRAGATLATAAAPAAAPVTLGAAGAHATPPGKSRPRQSAHKAKSHETSSPLTRTLTKIVGVVPTPIRMLIGALLALALGLGVRSRLIARRARRLERQRGELLEDVGLLQAALLPVAPARLGPVGTTAAYRPAAGPGAGGDFYDVFALEDGQLAVIVGDISGHGRKALPHTALVRFTMRAYLEAGLSPRGAVQTAATVLERQLGDSFATVIAATYNPRTRRLIYAGAGHPPPVVLARGPGQEPLELLTMCSAPPLGVGLASGTRQTIVEIPGGAQICFYTDGVTEARVGSELFGFARLAQTLAAIGAEGSAAELLDRVSAQADRRPDDMAACLLNISGPSATPHAVIEEVELDRESVASERVTQLLLACGVEAQEAATVLRSAARIVADTGSVVLEVHRADGHARVSFQNDNLTYLQTRHATRQADRMVTL
jgi:serine phosphatase RsbU (regulator of sigma subunit)